MIHPTATIDESVRIYGRKDLLKVGANTRIDAFCILSVGDEGIEIGNDVHISAGVYLYGQSGKIVLGDCCFLSPRVSVFTATDDMIDDVLVGSQINSICRSVIKGDVVLCDGSGIGTGSVILPRVYLGEGAVVGALSIVKESIGACQIVVGPKQRVIGSKDYMKVKTALKYMEKRRAKD